MKLEMIGLNHNTSALETRARAAIGPDRMEAVIARLLKEERVDGAVILSTCNRAEIYLSPQLHTEEPKLRTLFAEICDLTQEEAAACYVKRDDAAVEHLYRVASGLDSQLLGEVQVLSQVKAAYQTALELACTNGVLNTLFLRAIECGKLVRHRTAISQGAVSVAYAAVDVATRIFGKLDGRRILLVGAGETTRLAAKYLADFGGNSWRVSNRTRENAVSLAESLCGTTVAFPPEEADIAWADLIVSATSSSEVVITVETANAALHQRKDPMLILDLAVPRDVDDRLKALENVYLYSVDDFQDIVKANLKAREKEALRAEKLIVKQVEEFVTWYRENRVAPTIQQLKEVLETIRTAEVQNNARRFSPDNRDQVEEFSKSLMRKVTSLIIANMKRASLDRDDLSLAKAVSMAFAPSDDADVNHILERLDHELSH
jgi:glutamyl-tRNA reductase